MADKTPPDTNPTLDPNAPNTEDLSRGTDTPLQGNQKRIDVAEPGGHYIVNGVHVDANGNEIKQAGTSKDGK